ncbi:MAG: hypothetical protein V1908_04115 [Candidatus Peregrinibacteria bacterium]
MNHFFRKTNGFSILIIIMVVSAVGLLVALTASTTGIQETQNNLRYGLSKNVFSAGNGCLEDALMSLNQNHNYSGSSLVVDGVSCTITISGSGTARTVDVVAVNDGYTRHFQADADWNSSFAVTAWRELSN